MAELKLTKFELRRQQTRLAQLQRYLPTLQLRKAMLQTELIAAKLVQESLKKEFDSAWQHIKTQSALLGSDPTCDIISFVTIKSLTKKTENIAGLEVPSIDTLTFHMPDYSLFDTPPWLDVFVHELQKCRELFIKHSVAEERIQILSEEHKQVSTRVNLFEKVLIPRCISNIKKIRIVLGDLALMAISQAKIAKRKILERNSEFVSQL